MVGRPSFWLLADNSIELGTNHIRIGSFVAYLKHALLFHERLLLSDSLVVNTPNLRRALQVDPQLREYMATGCLVIARRKKGDQYLELTELRDSLRASGSTNQEFDQNPKSFLVNEDLAALQQFATCVPYDLPTISGYYTDKVRRLTVNPAFLEQLGEDADQVCHAILRRIEERGSVDQTFFERLGPDSLETQLGKQTWKRVSKIVYDFEAAYYRTAIPDTVGADIIFSAEHERHRQILRRIKPDGASGSVRVDLSRGARSLYEAVLSTLSAAKIKQLRESGEFIEFQTKLSALQQIDDIHTTRLEAAVKQVYESLRAYHERIDGDKEVNFLRYFQQGNEFMDRWHLRGILKGGCWLLRMGASVISQKTVRAAVATTFADWLHPDAKYAFLIYYSAGGYPLLEQALDALPDTVKEIENRQSIASMSTTAVEAYVDVVPLVRDTIYSTI